MRQVTHSSVGFQGIEKSLGAQPISSDKDFMQELKEQSYFLSFEERGYRCQLRWETSKWFCVCRRISGALIQITISVCWRVGIGWYVTEGSLAGAADDQYPELLSVKILRKIINDYYGNI